MNYKNINDYEMVYLVKENDEEALNVLFKKYEGVMFKLASKYFFKFKYIGISFDDLIQEARVGLLNALNNFKDDQSLFFSFASLCIERQIISYCRSYNTLKNYPLNFSVDEGIRIKDKFIYNIDIDGILMENEKFFESKNLLNFEQSLVFELRYNGFSYKEIAKLLDIPITTVDGRITMIRKCLKNNINITF